MPIGTSAAAAANAIQRGGGAEEEALGFIDSRRTRHAQAARIVVIAAQAGTYQTKSTIAWAAQTQRPAAIAPAQVFNFALHFQPAAHQKMHVHKPAIKKPQLKTPFSSKLCK